MVIMLGFGPLEIRFEIGVLWLIFGMYWVGSWLYDISTSRAKPAKKMQGNWARLSIVIIILIVVAVAAGPSNILLQRWMPVSDIAAGLGLAITAGGILFAFWARRHLGGNWSGIVMMKKGQTLTKTGPYAIVRHPIYTGMFIGMLGSAIALGDFLGLLILAVALLFFGMRMRAEEKLMLEEFGGQYVQYKKETKRFIPFIY